MHSQLSWKWFCKGKQLQVHKQETASTNVNCYRYHLSGRYTHSYNIVFFKFQSTVGFYIHVLRNPCTHGQLHLYTVLLWLACSGDSMDFGNTDSVASWLCHWILRKKVSNAIVNNITLENVESFATMIVPIPDTFLVSVMGVKACSAMNVLV